MITLKRLTAPALKRLRDVDLWLPRRGATLIEGPNESGKSTLFEAIYFALYGRPLVGEEPGKATLASLIPHDGAQAQVALTLLTGEVELKVTRTLTRSRNGGSPTSEASLVVRAPGRSDERINSVSAVNDRIVAELRGLDSDALRNSCFMEQKGLERLESLKRDEREEAISRLLGLERLVRIERSLAPTAEERRQAERLRAQEQVARRRRLAQEATLREGDVEQRLHAAELRGWVEQRDTLAAELETFAATEREKELERAEHEAFLARIATVRANERRLADAARWNWQTQQATRETTQLTARLVELDALGDAQGSNAQERLADIRRLELGLRDAFTERGVVEDAAVQFRLLREAQERELQAQGALGEAERLRTESVGLMARAQARETLTNWILARERADLREGRTQQLIALNSERGKYEREMAESAAIAKQWLTLTGAAAGVTALMSALAIILRLGVLWGIAALAGLALIALGVQWRQEIAAGRARAWKISQADQGITTVRAEVNLAQRLVSDDIGRLEAGLRAAGLPIPASVEEGDRLLHSLPTMGNLAEAEARMRQSEAMRARAFADIEQSQVEKERILVTLRTLGYSSDPEQLRFRQEAVASAITKLTDEARSLGLPADPTGLASARGAAEVTYTRVLTSEENRDEVHTRLLETQATLDNNVRAWAKELEIVAQALAPLGLAQDFALPETLDAATLEELHDQLVAQTQDALSQFDESEERELHARVIAERERLVTRSDELLVAARRLRDQIRERMGARGVSVQGDEPLERLIEAWPLLGEVSSGEVDELRTAREDARLETYHSEQTATEREREIALGSGPLDEDELRARVEEMERDLRQRELAARLAGDVRAVIIRRALPETEAYMRAILPELTAGRYHDISLLRDDASGGGETDLAIRMWDQQAERYVRKNLYSGGTRDQASLALRLAFALATLPKELGATPGFIFLDEPLSAFDEERSLALARVLTTGAIAQAFAQVFLISHSQVIDPRTFDYTLRMENGRIAESTLPTGALAEALWEAEENVGVAERLSSATA